MRTFGRLISSCSGDNHSTSELSHDHENPAAVGLQRSTNVQRDSSLLSSEGTSVQGETNKPPSHRILTRGSIVDSIDHYGNRRQRVEQLASAWNQESGGAVAPASKPDDPLVDVAAEPRRRPRTRLTDEEVDAMRTARAQGVSVNALARRFGVHRGTVWAKTQLS